MVAVTLLILTRTLERWGQYSFLARWSLFVVLIVSVASAIQYFVVFLRNMPLEEPRGRSQ